jgi:hypothetical protein
VVISRKWVINFIVREMPVAKDFASKLVRLEVN